MKKMKLILFVLTIFSSIAWATGVENIPASVLNQLAQTKIEECKICIDGLYEDAYEELNAHFKNKKIFKTTNTNYLVKSNKTKMEFILEKDSKPKLYKKHKKLGDAYWPQIVYKFYTEKNKMVGIQKNDLTNEKLAKLFTKSKKGQLFKAEIEIISNKFGDGDNFLYFAKTNTLQVQCKIVKLSKVSK